MHPPIVPWRTTTRRLAAQQPHRYSRSVKRVDPADSVAVVDDGVDVSLSRWMLDLSPSERLDVLQGFTDSVGELRDGEDSSVP